MAAEGMAAAHRHKGYRPPCPIADAAQAALSGVSGTAIPIFPLFLKKKNANG
jgi:hypothetical protein